MKHISLVLLSCLFSAACGSDPGAPASAANQSGVRQSMFETTEMAEAVATLTVRCDPCAWDRAGSEAVVLAIRLDDGPVQHLPLVRTGRADYQVLLGAVSSGRHTVSIDEEASLTASALRGKEAGLVERIVVDQIASSAPNYQAISRAPFVHARADTVGRFTDVPVLMWYEVEPSTRGTRYRYTVIFTNEDGGTPADRLMATWGRTTDIEYIYSVELDASGVVIGEDMQGPGHEILAFNGRRDGQHPLLWVSTENNMVLDHGTTAVRYAPAAILADLNQVSRETVMDAHPWTYEVMAKELMRERKVVADAPPGQGVIPDPRRFVYLEGCGEAGNNALVASMNVNGTWVASDRGLADYRITRNGCFRAAIPLPGASTAREIQSVRVHAFPRKDKPGQTPSRLTRLNTVFSLDEHFAPQSPIVRWEGSVTLTPGAQPFEIAVR